MKSRLVTVLTFGLILCLAALIAQRHHYQTQTARQEQAIALAQAQADALRKEVTAARQIAAKREAAHAALTSAKTLAPRYEALNKITGYEKKETPIRN